MVKRVTKSLYIMYS